ITHPMSQRVIGVSSTRSRRSRHVRFDPKATEVLRCRFYSRRPSASAEKNTMLKPGHIDIVNPLSVSDIGTGIAPDILPRVFDPFFTTKRTSEGSGLGLSQVHGFVHQSGGTVTIRSELGHGTCVTMYLPRVETASKQGDLEGALERLDGG